MDPPLTPEAKLTIASPLDTSTSQPDITPEDSEVTNPTPKFLTADMLEALLQMQKTDPFCKRISKCLSNGKAPQHKKDLFTHIRGLLYKYVTDSWSEVPCFSYT